MGAREYLGTLLSRREVAVPDKKLAKLLKLKKDDELTYFNLQRDRSPHFAKSGKTSVSSA